MALDLSALDAAPLGLGPTGTPVMLPLNVLTEDPENPRTAFDATTLSELAEDIRQRGILQPIIVRSMVQGRYVIRFGARRYRAAQIAGLTEVPCFIATDTRQFDSYAQVAENEQRESLSPMELAAFVAKRVSLGEKKNVIAKGINLSLPALTFLLALVDPPPFLLEIYQSGKCTSPQYLYHLRNLHQQNAALVERATAEAADITRQLINEIAAAIHEEKSAPLASQVSPKNDGASAPTTNKNRIDRDADVHGNESKPPEMASPKPLRNAIVRIKHQERAARLTLTRQPSAVGQGWIQYLDDGSEREIELATAALEALLEA